MYLVKMLLVIKEMILLELIDKKLIEVILKKYMLICY
jgi:hypothetical protein